MADDRTGRFDVWLKRAALIVALLVGVTTLFSLARPHLPEDWRWYACSFPFFMAVVGVMFVVGSRQPNTINIPVALAAALFMALDKHGVYAAHVAGRPGATLEYAACCIALAVWACAATVFIVRESVRVRSLPDQAERSPERESDCRES